MPPMPLSSILVDVAQGDGLHGPAAVARDGQPSAHGSLGRHGDALDGVDGRDGVGSGEVGTHGRQPHVGDVGRHLGYDGNPHAVLHVGGVGGHQFRVLPHVAAHARQSHLRTGEVQFHGVAARLLGHPCQFDPFLLKLSHDRGHDDLRGVVALQSAQDVEVHRVGVLAQLLHVAEGVEVGRALLHGIEAWRHLADVLLADGLVEHAGPPCVEGPRHHLVVGAYGRRGQEERVLAAYAAEGDGKGGGC